MRVKADIKKTYENSMLETLTGVDLGSGAPVMPVLTPRSLLYLPSPRIQIIEDLHSALDCANLLRPHSDGIPLSLWSDVGFALGEWLRALHRWTQEPEQGHLRSTMEGNKASRDLKWQTTYGTIVDIARTFPIITEEGLDVLKEVREKAEREQEDAAQRAVNEDTESYGIIHSDFWTGKYADLFTALSYVAATKISVKRPPDSTTSATAPRHRLRVRASRSSGDGSRSDDRRLVGKGLFSHS